MILSKLEPYVRADIEAGNAVILKSASGRGKSMWSNGLYNKLKAEGAQRGLKWGGQSMFLATQNPTDMMGCQYKGKIVYDGREITVSDPALPMWAVSTEGLPCWAYDRFFLLLDEYGQGEADVKRVSAELLLHGRIGPWVLPPFSARIACSNSGPRYGVTKDFDFVINRRGEYSITDDLGSFLHWCDGTYEHQGKEWSVMPVTKAWAKSNPNAIFEAEPEKQGPWCTPRSAIDNDRWLQCFFKDKEINPSDPGVIEASAGKIGMAGTQSYMGFLQFRLELPSYESVVAAPMETPVPKPPDLQMLMAYEMAAQTQREHLPQVISYMQRLPKDLAITFVTSLVRRDNSVLLDPAMSAWTDKNATLLSMVMSLA